MKLLTFFCVAITWAAAAPVPKSDQFKLEGWGDPVDPLKDCTFTVKDGKLTITVPGKGRDLSIHTGNMESPRVLREIEGDFQIDMTVDGDWALGTKTTVKDRPPFFGAGLFLYQDDKNYIRLEKAQWESGCQKPCYVSWEMWKDGEFVKSGTVSDGELDRTKPVQLRLIRKGDSVSGAFSPDGKTWTVLKELDAKFAAKLKVGVAAVHTTDAEFKPVFSDLKIEKLEASK